MRKRAAVVGATGIVGQQCLAALAKGAVRTAEYLATAGYIQPGRHVGQRDIAAEIASMMANTELRGERLRLRDFSAEDIEDVFTYASDPLVTRYAGWAPHRTPYDSMVYIQRCLNDDWGPVTFAVEYVAERRVIGVVDIRIVSRLWALGEIGYTLGRYYWGRGFNVEDGRLLVDYGFRDLGLRRIQAICDTANRRSYRTMEKLGMIREQVIFGERVWDGRPADRFVYSILRREWERRKREAEAADVLQPQEPNTTPMQFNAPIRFQRVSAGADLE